MNEKVAFTSMDQGSKADYELVASHDRENAAEMADRVISWLQQMDGASPYKISRLEHCLQTATRAENDRADDETIACALLHDIGDIIAPTNHSAIAAALLHPYVCDQNHWIVKYHGLFQGYYYFEHFGLNPNERERLKGHEYYDACVEFCARWDQTSFDPDYTTQPLAHFEPLIHDLFAQQPRAFV